jgi:hypothetical protein
MAQTRGLSLADFLWELQAEEGHDVVGYRCRLFALTGFTSAHYIPHPVRLADAGCALIFLAPGFEGTGSDAVISVRRQTGVRAVMMAGDAWRRKPNADQSAYFLSCLLGGVHGICVRDLLPVAGEDLVLAAELASRIKPALSEEVGRFLTATGISRESYRRSFGEPAAALVRSGLGDFLHNGIEKKRASL